jgi:hypothetical protein
VEEYEREYQTHDGGESGCIGESPGDGRESEEKCEKDYKGRVLISIRPSHRGICGTGSYITGPRVFGFCLLVIKTVHGSYDRQGAYVSAIIQLVAKKLAQEGDVYVVIY